MAEPDYTAVSVIIVLYDDHYYSIHYILFLYTYNIIQNRLATISEIRSIITDIRVRRHERAYTRRNTTRRI